jgi:hypothetical protein
VYDPEELKTRIVSDPEVLTVGDPVVVPEYFAVAILSITTPLPPDWPVP